jgi:hypothetical protein
MSGKPEKINGVMHEGYCALHYAGGIVAVVRCQKLIHRTDHLPLKSL